MQHLEQSDYVALIDGARLETEDSHGPKVYCLKDGRYLKLFRQKHAISWSKFYPYALRFQYNSLQLLARDVQTIHCDAVVSIPSIARTGVIYQGLEGNTLRSLPEADFPAQQLGTYLNVLHESGVYFRSCHLGNVLQLRSGQLALIDIADMRLQDKPISLLKRLRNFKHLLRYRLDSDKLALDHNADFWEGYFEHTSLTDAQKVWLRQKVTRLSAQPRYLIVAPSWVGDMVMAHTLVRTIREQYPRAVIDMLAPKWTHPLVKAMPGVEQAIESPFAHGELKLLQRYRLAQQLRKSKYTHAIVLPNSFKSALVPWLARIPKRTGWRGEFRYGLLNDVRKLDKAVYPLMIERFMALGKKKGKAISSYTPQLSIDNQALDHVVEKFGLDCSLPAPIVFAPGAEYGEAKRWPAAYFKALAQMLLEKGIPVWLLGSKNDTVLGEQIMEEPHPLLRNFIGHTELNEALALIAQSGFVVTNDSGLMHVAAALDKPMIAIYGSSDTAFTPPLSEKAKVIHLHLSCSPCFNRVCPLEHLDCLKNISPEMVFEQLMEWKQVCAY